MKIDAETARHPSLAEHAIAIDPACGTTVARIAGYDAEARVVEERPGRAAGA